MSTTDRGQVVLAEQGRGRPRRGRVVALVLLVLIVALGYAGWSATRTMLTDLVPPACTATAAGASTTLSPEQTANAATIAAVSVRRDLPARAATVAIATAMQESKLRNLTIGDRDSVGLFQQRPSQGWGTGAQILDPVYASNAFYDRLVKVTDWADRPLTEVAQQVQRSAFPTAYAQHEDEARILASVLTGHSPEGLVCTLRAAERPSDAPAVAAALTAQSGLPATASGATVTVAAAGQPAWAAAAWAVAHAEGRAVASVRVGARAWLRADGDRWREADPAGGVVVTVVSSS